MKGQIGWFLTKFFSMNDNCSTNRTDNHLGFFQRTRNKFAVLQEIGFERNENKLRELLKDERDLALFARVFSLAVHAFVPAGAYSGPDKCIKNECGH